MSPCNNAAVTQVFRPVPAPGHFSQSKFKIAQALPYRTFHRASFLHGEIDDADRHRCWLLHRRSRHRRAGDCSGSSSMHQRRPPCPPLPPTALRYPGIFCRLFCCLCSARHSYVKSKLYNFFYWAIQDARSDEGLAREVILYALLSIASPYPIWGSTEPSPVAANAITSTGDDLCNSIIKSSTGPFWTRQAAETRPGGRSS